MCIHRCIYIDYIYIYTTLRGVLVLSCGFIPSIDIYLIAGTVLSTSAVWGAKQGPCFMELNLVVNLEGKKRAMLSLERKMEACVSPLSQ